MRSASSLAAALLLGVTLTGCAAVQSGGMPAAPKAQLQQNMEASAVAEAEAVRGVVEDFG